MAETGLSQAEVREIRRDFPMTDKRVHGKPLIYLDNAATSLKPIQMADRIRQVYAHEYARPQEGHTLSKIATKDFAAVREQLQKLLNAQDSRELVFCRGATEAINIVAAGLSLGPLQAD